MSAFSPIQYHTHIGLLEHLAGIHYLEVPAEVVTQLGGRFNRRLMCTVNGHIRFQCGLVALGQGRGYINFSKKRRQEGKLRLGDRVSVELAEDTSVHGMEMPEELTELLNQDGTGRQRFAGLTPGKQRYVIQYVGTVKSSQLRIERAILLLENLKQLPVGKETFPGMLGLKR